MITKVYESNLDALLDGYRVIANKGGTRSGKTYSIVSLLADLAMMSKKAKRIDVVSESLPHLKRGALNDMEDILTGRKLTEGKDYTYNRTDRIFTFKSGGKIRFFSADDWGKIKGSSRDVLFINECNRVAYEVYRQLAVRTRETVFLDWNPDSEFWYELKGIQGKKETMEIHSTYVDNPFLTDVQIAEIESNKNDENWWNVYGLGLTGRAQGLIYTNWEMCDDIPEDATLVGTGLDFGFTTDPTAIVAVYKCHGELWMDERMYMRAMTNDRISGELRGTRGTIVADSAEMKSITEIYNYGIKNIEPAQKGSDSVRAGIQILKRYKINVTKRSLNLIFELRNYKWKENRLTGELTGEPSDKFNHLLDAARYVALNLLSEKKKPRGMRVRTSNI